MQITNAVLAALMGLAATVKAVLPVQADEVLVAGNTTYNIIPIDWYIQMNDANTPYNLTATGTIEDLFDAITQHDLATAETLNATVNALFADLVANKTASIPTGDSDYIPTTIYCHIFQWANTHRLYQGIAYLAGLKGNPSNGPGPGTCGRVSCSYSAAIYWCNDNLETKILDSFHNIGDGVMLIIDQCLDSPYDSERADGQQFFQDGWNVIARYESC